jgi:hypothetical protein
VPEVGIGGAIKSMKADLNLSEVCLPSLFSSFGTLPIAQLSPFVIIAS